MMKQVYCNNPVDVLALIEREVETPNEVVTQVKTIIFQVNALGDKAVLDYTETYDGVRLRDMKVSPQEMQEAMNAVDPYFLSVMEQAKENIWSYHSKQKRNDYSITDTPGVMLGQRVLALDSVGVYVPGGTARYPSTVLMDVIPAKIAGVKEIVMVSPPDKNGKIPVDILAAAQVAGVDTIYKVGGAQAIAALAYGTETIPRVDKIVGPGNIYVATAKQQVFGLVDIDMIAGPSEILVIADDSANPDYLAMDLLSQAEHDPMAASFLVTTSELLAEQTKRRIAYHLDQLPRKDTAAHSLENYGAVIVTDTLELAAQISNQLAPEHLEICTEDPFALLPLIRHAGSVFLGHYAPEALGDYFAGPNHTLPTSGTARFSSGLSVNDFVKTSSYIYYSKEALQKVGKQVMTFAQHEGLDAHARSVELRLEEDTP